MMLYKGKRIEETGLIEVEIKGDIGCGKSLLMNRIILLLQQEGYNIVHPTQVKEFKKEHSFYVKPEDVRVLEIK